MRTGLTQEQRTARTRAALLQAAQELFAERGFAGTGREDIADLAGVTRGALYHHFASKADLFRAVVVEIDRDLVEGVVTLAGDAPTAAAALHESCRAYISACGDPTVARILADAPSVFGADEFRQISASSCTQLLVAGLEQAAAEGAPLPADLETTAALLLGMLDEAALLVATLPHRTRAVIDTVDQLLVRMFGI